MSCLSVDGGKSKSTTTKSPSKLTPTSKKVATPHGARIVHKGPRNGKYVKLNGKLVPVAKIPKKCKHM